MIILISDPRKLNDLLKVLQVKIMELRLGPLSLLLSSSKSHTPDHYSIQFENVAVLSSNPSTGYLTLDKQLTVLGYQPGYSFRWSSLSLISTWKNYTFLSKHSS